VIKLENGTVDFIVDLGGPAAGLLVIVGLPLLVGPGLLVGKGVYPLNIVTGLLSVCLLGTFFRMNNPVIPGTENDFSSISYVTFNEHKPDDETLLVHIDGTSSTIVFPCNIDPFNDIIILSGV
jgi:hypothetical protein